MQIVFSISITLKRKYFISTQYDLRKTERDVSCLMDHHLWKYSGVTKWRGVNRQRTRNDVFFTRIVECAVDKALAYSGTCTLLYHCHKYITA